MEENRVSLDGEAIRRIREEKKLTQLYVAKVVGVTTDTVSRWENNRYPSVRRENAVQLAEALEVPVEDVLRNSEYSNSEETSSPSRFSRAYVAASLLLLGCAIAVFWWWPKTPLPPAVVGERLLPVYAAPLTVIPVRLHLEAAKSVDGLVLRENFPTGWQLVEASPPPSSLDNVNGMARWIVQQGGVPLQISYLLRVGSQSVSGLVPFRGEVVVSQGGRNSVASVGGDTQIRWAPFHWADINGDLMIDDSEALDASVASIEMKKTHLDWATVEKIWDAGGYSFDPVSGVFTPVHP
jgi:transcriptional regulator with XRE-family HTH domain